MDVLCRVSVSASTYDLHYDQRRNACWCTTGDLVQTGEGGEVQEEMEEGQQMESCVEGAGSAEASRQADSEDTRLSVRIFFYVSFTQTRRRGRIRWQVGFTYHPPFQIANKTILINMQNFLPLHNSHLWSLIWFHGYFFQHSRCQQRKWRVYFFLVQICRSQVCIFPHERHIPSVHSELIEADGSKNWYFLHVRDVSDVNRCVVLSEKKQRFALLRM